MAGTGISTVKLINAKLMRTNTFSEASARWSNHKLGSTGMSVDLPGKLEALDTSFHFAAFVEEQRIYACEEGDLNAVMAYASYSDTVKPTAEGALKGSADGMRKTVGISNLSYMIKSVDESTFALDGQFIKDEAEYTLRGYSVVKKQKAWLILAFYDSSNNAAGSAAQRILDSMKISGQ
jgi:hypothetical protein